MRPNAKERAAAYIRKAARPAIAGQHGDDTTHAVACALVVDFGLTDQDAAELLSEYNRTKCQPPWSERDLERHLRSARRTANGKPGDVGKALEQDSPGYNGPRLAPNKGDAKSAASVPKPAQGGQPNPGGAFRTPRTPLFQIRPFGEGASRRTPRAVRTLSTYSPQSSVFKTPSDSSERKKEVSGMSEIGAQAPTPPTPANPPKPMPQPQRAPTPRPEPCDVTMIWTKTGEIIRNGKLVGNLNDGKHYGA